MATTTTTTSVIQHDDKPEKYKDIFIMFLKAVSEANKTTKEGKHTVLGGSLDQKITAYKDFIRIAQAILPDDPAEKHYYDRNRLNKLKPNYKTIEKEYFTHVKLLFPEMRNFHIPQIRQRWKEEYIENLQREFGDVTDLVYEHTGWNFDETHGLNTGQVGV